MFAFKQFRCEWQVVLQNVDQYGQPMQNARTVLAIWPTVNEAYADMPNHAVAHPYVEGRWIPKNTTHGYQEVQVQYREVLVNDV